MLYERRDIEALNRILVRKSLESATYKNHQGFNEAERMILTEELTRDVARCSFMLAVGLNDLWGFESRLQAFDSLMTGMPPKLYRKYMDSLGEQDREDEGHFMWMTTVALGSVDLLRRGVEAYKRLAAAQPVLDQRETSALVSLKSKLDGILERCDFIGEEEVWRFAEALARGCTALVRINTGKEVSSPEASVALDQLAYTDGEAFMRVHRDELTEDEARMVESLEETNGRMQAILCGRCILNSDIA